MVTCVVYLAPWILFSEKSSPQHCSVLVHSQVECDSVHSATEVAKKTIPLNAPLQWNTLISLQENSKPRNAVLMKCNNVIDLKDFVKKNNSNLRNSVAGKTSIRRARFAGSGCPAVHRNNLVIPRSSSSGSFGISRLEHQTVLPKPNRHPIGFWKHRLVFGVGVSSAPIVSCEFHYIHTDSCRKDGSTIYY